MSQSYLACVGKNYSPTIDEPIMESLFSQYERVIVESLITTFGLDFLVRDQHGGDVDTLHNVRQIDEDDQMTYKSAQNQQAYEQRGEYSYDAYHGKNENYRKMTGDARKAAQQAGKPQPITDTYTGKTVYIMGKSKGAPADKKASLDHIISAKSIHEDRGRVLADLKGEELANTQENLVFTNASLNSSMQASEIPDYIEKHPELDDKTKNRMMQCYDRAKKSYEGKIARAYYTGPGFRNDLAVAAGNVGVRMGIRQAVGFVFVEMSLL